MPNFILGTKLGYVKDIKYLGRLSTKEEIYSALETTDIRQALIFPSNLEAEQAAQKVWLFRKEGYAVLEIIYQRKGTP